MINGLFIVGNKRSGTSQLVRLLNMHPNIFISHESDIIWILYQFHHNKPFVVYPSDSPKGMEYTLKECKDVLKKEKKPAENFFAVQKHLMEKGSPWLPAMEKSDLSWVGDKKPFQCSDPLLADFIQSIFSKAVFIHLIRHPFAVAFSSEQFNATDEGDFWKGMTLEEKVKEWTRNEKNVLELKKTKWARVLDIKYEDLCRYTDNELVRIYDFLGLEFDKDILKKAAKNTRYKIKKIPQITCSEETRRMMELYGYTPEQASKSRTKVLLSNIYWNVRKKLL